MVIERLGHFRFPIILLVLFEAFIIGSVLLGTGLQCYGIRIGINSCTSFPQRCWRDSAWPFLLR